MIDHDSARALVLRQLSAMPAAFMDDDWVILDHHTIERSWGWVFCYDSRKYLETGDDRFLVAGNAPFIVRRIDGAVFITGTARPLEDYIEDFEKGGSLTFRCD
jgi:hypothetical protein